MAAEIRIINFDKFKIKGEMPRFPDDMDMAQDLSSLDRSKFLLVFISHCWMRGYKEAPGYDKRPHPDNASHDKYKLCVSGIQKIKNKFAPEMKECYIWLDFGCINQDAEPAAELKQLDEIVRNCDILFTPIVGANKSNDTTIDNWYEDYKNDAWNNGVHSYTRRCWCRVEMLYAAYLPTINTPDRVGKFKYGLQLHATNEVRPHMLYGISEMEGNLMPLMLPPMLFSYYDKLDPMKGEVTVKSDLEKIQELVNDLQEYREKKEKKYCASAVGFKGTLKNGIESLEGKGTYIYANGDRFEGSFKDNKKSGKGKMIHFQGDTYVGQYDNDLKNGEGVMTWPTGEYYSGNWKDGKRHGKGKMSYDDDAWYEGDWEAHFMNGQGVLCIDGTKYEGLFVKDKKTGKGNFIDKDGNEYVGEYSNNMFNGKGRCSWKNTGDIYEGDYVNDKKKGHGIYFWGKDKYKYDGQWDNDKQNGEGVLYDQSGKIMYKGYWSNGEYSKA